MRLAIVAAFVLAAFAPQARWPVVIERAAESVVVIATEKAQGSGFFVKADGTLITNHHVIDGAKTIAVTTSTGEVYKGAFLLASDAQRDLAVLRVDAFGVKAIELGDSNDLKVGAPVLLLGAPRGLEQSATDGIVSAIRLDASGTRLIQTSTASSPGSSGGPLLSDSGTVVGVLSFGITQSQNLNFAIPINYARGLLQRLGSVATAPERRLEPLAEPARAAVSSPASSPVLSKPKVAGGIFVTGFGTSDYLQAAYLELTGTLAAGGIRIVERSDVEDVPPTSSVGRFVEAAREAGADGLLYFTLSLGWNQTDRLKVQCFDRTGTLLWEEETTSRWQMSYNAAFDAVASRMRDRLRARLGGRQFPGQRPAPAAAARPDPSLSGMVPSSGKWSISLPETTAHITRGQSGEMRLELRGRYRLTADLRETAAGFEGEFQAPTAAGCAIVPLKIVLVAEAGGLTGRMDWPDCSAMPPVFRSIAFRLMPQ